MCVCGGARGNSTRCWENLGESLENKAYRGIVGLFLVSYGVFVPSIIGTFVPSNRGVFSPRWVNFRNGIIVRDERQYYCCGYMGSFKYCVLSCLYDRFH